MTSVHAFGVLFFPLIAARDSDGGGGGGVAANWLSEFFSLSLCLCNEMAATTKNMTLTRHSNEFAIDFKMHRCKKKYIHYAI